MLGTPPPFLSLKFLNGEEGEEGGEVRLSMKSTLSSVIFGNIIVTGIKIIRDHLEHNFIC